MTSFFPWLFEKSFERIIVRTTRLEQNKPVRLSLFFKEVVEVVVLLPSQLFKQLSIVDAPLLLTTKTDAIAEQAVRTTRQRTPVCNKYGMFLV